MRKLQVCAEFFTICVFDSIHEGDLPALLRRRSFDRLYRVTASRHAMFINTERSGIIDFDIGCYDVAPDCEMRTWDHIVEASIDVESGYLCISSVVGIDGEVASINLASGTYRLRMCQANLESVSDPDAEVGSDRYLVILWPAEFAEPRAIKIYKSAVGRGEGSCAG